MLIEFKSIFFENADCRFEVFIIVEKFHKSIESTENVTHHCRISEIPVSYNFIFVF